VFSGLDLVRAGVNAGVPAILATNPAVNPFLGLRGLQFLPPFLNFPNAVEDGRTNDSKFTYTLRAAYKLSDNFSAYATYATGFKASSVNLSRDSRPLPINFIPGSPAQSPAPAASPIRTAGLAVNNLTTGTRSADPENAVVYEIGLKGQFDGFGFNLALFKQSLSGFQGNIFTGTGFVLGNAEKQSTTGIELDATMSPIRNLTITTNFTYLNPKFDSFIGGTALQPGSFATVPTNLSGLRPAGIPEFSYTIGGTYTADINDTMKAIFHVDYFGSSPVLIAQGLNFKREEQSLNASITLALTRGLEVSIWGRNLADSQYITTLFPGVAQAGSLQGYPSQPRTYGGLVRYRF
jgi:outer membrane receptor protein involved in Fe transport